MRLEEGLRDELFCRLEKLFSELNSSLDLKGFYETLEEMKMFSQGLTLQDITLFFSKKSPKEVLSQAVEMALREMKAGELRPQTKILLDRIVSLILKSQNQSMAKDQVSTDSSINAAPFVREFLLDAQRNFLKLNYEDRPEVLFRVIHTIKGNAIAFGVDEIASEAKKIEDLLAKPSAELEELHFHILKIFEIREKLIKALPPEDEKLLTSINQNSQIKVETNSEVFTYSMADILKVEWNPELIRTTEGVVESPESGLRGYWQTEAGIIPVFSRSKSSKIGILLKNQTAVLVDSILEVSDS